MLLSIHPCSHRGRVRRAFTIVELLVAAGVVCVLLMVVFSVMTQTSKIWRHSADKIQAYQGARLAFQVITQNLGQATLNTYLDYDDAINPQAYLRKSDLRFISGTAGNGGLPGTTGTGQAFFFQAPLGYATNAGFAGMETLLNTCGYYVSFATNIGLPSHVTPASNPYRYRLMQLLVPTESNRIYDSAAAPTGWFASYTSLARPVADNVIAIIVRPQDPKATATELPNSQYAYDSTLGAGTSPQPVTANQLPPIVHVTLVAIDEASARRLENGALPPAEIATALAGKFATAANYDTDLADLLSKLKASSIQYRVFSSAVQIRESKWTK